MEVDVVDFIMTDFIEALVGYFVVCEEWIVHCV